MRKARSHFFNTYTILLYKMNSKASHRQNYLHLHLFEEEDDDDDDAGDADADGDDST